MVGMVAILVLLSGAVIRAQTPGSTANAAAPPAQRVPADGSTDVHDASRQDDASTAIQAVPAKVIRYAERLIDQRDRDGDKSLDRQEWGHVWGFLTCDANLDGRVSLEELVRRIATYGRYRRVRLLPPIAGGSGDFPALLNPTTDSERTDANRTSSAEASTADNGSAPDASSAEPDPGRVRKFVPSPLRQPEGLPSWFASRDADGDGQLSMAEFAPKPTGTSLAEFSRYDQNGDGMITPSEYIRAGKSSGK